MPDAKRIGVCPADDHVIQKVDGDCLGGFAELSGDVEVRSAGRRVAGRMIVGARNCGRGLANGGPEDLSRMRELRLA